MRYRALLITVIIALYMTGVFANSKKNGGVVHVADIVFKGLDRVDDDDLMEKIRHEKINNTVLVDTLSLKRVLDGNGLIKRYSASVEDNVLVIHVIERSKKYYMLLKGDSVSVPFEVGPSFKLLCRDYRSAPDKPIIIVEKKDLREESVSGRVEALCRLIDTMGEKYSAVYDEISDVEFAEEGSLKVRMKKRPAVFILPGNVRGFKRLLAVTGHLDRVRRYNGTIDLREPVIFLK